MLENLDGRGSADNIMVVASTNRPEVIDPAIKRPGRIDRIVEVPLPDEQGRRQIFQIHFVKAEKLAERQLLNNGVDYDAIVRETEKMSGADIAEVVRRVLEEKVRKEGVGEKADLVTTEDILREIKSYERTRKSQSIGFSAQLQATPAV
jgi:ATP-dependent 26S proteasome regulatory subunit